MTVEYRLVQFLADPERQEARNVALVVLGAKAIFRAVGLKRNGEVDTRLFEPIAGPRSYDAWVWAEWLEWLATLTQNHSTEEICEVLNDLGSRHAQFNADFAGQADFLNDDESVHGLADRLFEKLVGHPAMPRQDRFKFSIDTLFKNSGLSSMVGFHRDVEIELPTLESSPPVLLDFPALLAEEPRAGFKFLQFQHKSTADVQAQLSDSRLTLERAVDLQFLSRHRCFILHDTPSRQREGHLVRLKQFAHLINIDRGDAATRLRAVTVATT